MREPVAASLVQRWRSRTDDMTSFPDLSPYRYIDRGVPGALNVAWLSLASKFETQVPSEDDLDRLWEFCKIRVNQTRGRHDCVFCDRWRLGGFQESRRGQTITLGSAEIRVISRSGQTFAAPNLIFHYMQAHLYKPPAIFLDALRTGPQPRDDAYFEALRTRELHWNEGGIAP